MKLSGYNATCNFPPHILKGVPVAYTTYLHFISLFFKELFVAGAGFEPATFRLAIIFRLELKPRNLTHAYLTISRYNDSPLRWTVPY